MRHWDVPIQLMGALTISIEEEQLTITPGLWPTNGEPVQVAAASVALQPTDHYVYVDHDGGIVMAEKPLPYRPQKLNAETMLDLLAFRNAEDGWVVKRLVGNV